MLIDWITARVGYEHFSPEDWQSLRLLTDRVMRFCPRTGIVQWETSSWDSVRSDSHSLAFRVGGDAFWMQGSPARVCGDGCAVFGSGPSSALDLVGCVRAMALFLSSPVGVALPLDHKLWVVSRIDITQNLYLENLPNVRLALRMLRECEGGRYRVSQQAGDTVYWSHKSKMRSGKAYAKGPHLSYMTSRRQYTGYPYSEEQIFLAGSLLRLELKLGCEWFRHNPKSYHEMEPKQIKTEWEKYFNRMIGDATMKTESDVKARIFQAAELIARRKNPNSKGEGLGRAAYGLWLLIHAEGWEKAREAQSKTTWYRNLQVLHAAGLGDMDIAVGNVVPFRQRIIESVQVNSWADLKRAA